MKKFNFRLLFFLIGVAGMVILFIELDPQNIPWDSLFDTNTIYLLLGLLGLWVLIYVTHALSYIVILGEERKKISFLAMLKICVSGFALNNVTPAGLVGGEPYRIMELKRYCSVEKASSSTLTFSLFYIIGHFLLWLTTIILYYIYGCPGETYMTVILSICFAIGIVTMFFFFFSRKKSICYPFFRFVGKLPFMKKPIDKLLQKKKETFIEIDNNIKEFRTKKEFWIVLVLQYVSRLLEAVEYMLILMHFGAKLDYIQAVVIFGTASLIGNLVFIIPMQAGVREGGLALALAFFGITEGICATASIVYRVRDLICIFVGIMLVLVTKKKKSQVEEVLAHGVNGEVKNNDTEVLEETAENTETEIKE